MRLSPMYLSTPAVASIRGEPAKATQTPEAPAILEFLLFFEDMIFIVAITWKLTSSVPDKHYLFLCAPGRIKQARNFKTGQFIVSHKFGGSTFPGLIQLNA